MNYSVTDKKVEMLLCSKLGIFSPMSQVYQCIVAKHHNFLQNAIIVTLLQS